MDTFHSQQFNTQAAVTSNPAIFLNPTQIDVSVHPKSLGTVTLWSTVEFDFGSQLRELVHIAVQTTHSLHSNSWISTSSEHPDLQTPQTS